MSNLHGPASFRRGDTFIIDGTCRNADGSIMALPDGTELEWRLDALDGAIVLNFTKDNGIAITNADAGTVKITITPVQSDIAPGVYQDAFRVTLPDGSKSTQWTGSITVKPSLFVLG